MKAKKPNVVRVDNPSEDNHFMKVFKKMEAMREITSKYAKLRANIIGSTIPKIVFKKDENGKIVGVERLYSDDVEKALKELKIQEDYEIDELNKETPIYDIRTLTYGNM